MKQDSLIRPVMRRADAGVDSITVNGQPSGGATGPLNLVSPMASFLAPNTIQINNGFTNTLAGKTLTSGIVQNDLDTDFNNEFQFGTGAGPGPFTIPKPKIPLAQQATFAAGTPYVRNRKLTFHIIIQAAGLSISWDNSVDGYQFANNARAGAVGPFLADWNALLAGAQVNDVLKVGFEYNPSSLFNPRWECVALAGPFLGQ